MFPVNRTMKRFKVFLVFALSLISATQVCSAPRCCEKNLTMLFDRCDDGEKILLKCDGVTIPIFPYISTHSYIIRNDSLGEYLDDYIDQFIVRSPK